MLLRPVYGADATLTDFTYEYLNPAAQQLLGLPECPAESFLTLYPAAQAEGIFAFYGAAFASTHPKRYHVNYQHDGLDGYFHLAAQRSGEWLVVNFTDTNSQPRSAVEEALRQSQAREQAARTEAERQRGELQRAFEQAPVAIAVYQGPQYTIELANATVCRLWGRRAEDIVGKGLFEALPEVAGLGYEQLLDRVMATGEPYVAHAMEAVHEREGRRDTVYWDFVYVPVYAEAGPITGAMVVATEVTQQVLARRQLEHHAQELERRVQERTRELTEQQALLGQILGQVPAAIATLSGPEHQFSFFNEQYQRLINYRAAYGASVATAIPEAQQQGFLALLDQVFHSGQPYVGTEVPIWLTQASGGTAQHFLNFTYQPLRDKQGQVWGILAFIVEVTAQVLAQREREAQRQLIETVFEQAPAGIWVVREPRLFFEFINPAMERILGHSREQVLGRPYFEVLPELVTQGLPELFSRVWEQGENILVEELPARLAYHAPDERGYFTFTFAPLRDEQGAIARICCTALDVTAQVLARQQVQTLNQKLATINEKLLLTNEELHQTNTRLTRTNTDLDTFVYTASHDLKAPIANIEGLLAALRDHLPAAVQADEETSQLLEMMQRAVERFQFTINQLTDVARLQHEHEQPTEHVALATVIEDVQLDLLPLLTSTRARLTVQVDPDVTALFAPKHLRSVVYNLLSNALKYHQPGRPPLVQLHAARQAQAVVLTVTDNGLGLSEQQQKRLFGLFQRLHTHVEGTGVGLYTVKRLVENAGGTITVTSEVGVGTTFTITFATSRLR